MKILKNYQNLFLITKLLFVSLIISMNFSLEAKEEFILLGDLTESSEQYGFYQLDLRLASTFHSEKKYILKVYNLPNKNIMLADGDIVHRDTIKPMEDRQFVLYLKPIKEGAGSIVFKVKTEYTLSEFNAQYSVSNKKQFNGEKNIEVESLVLKINSPIKRETGNDTVQDKVKIKDQTLPADQNHINSFVSLKKTSLKNRVIKWILAVLSVGIILGMFYYKKRTRFFK